MYYSLTNLVVVTRVGTERSSNTKRAEFRRFKNVQQIYRTRIERVKLSRIEPNKLQFTFLLVQRLESDAVTDLTPGIWSHVHLKRSKKVGDEMNSLHGFDVRDT
ncbi:hypothetical protein J6590_066842 [Homalodisca vitripennis]|nr:hypothetical protein J6590_066842 [Homalodisca vitripennis]